MLARGQRLTVTQSRLSPGNQIVRQVSEDGASGVRQGEPCFSFSHGLFATIRFCPCMPPSGRT